MADQKPAKKLRFTFNAPVVLTYAMICICVLALNHLTGGTSNARFFSVYRAPLKSLATYFRFIGHIFGHANLEHMINNLMILLVLGPMLEEKYGSKSLALLMLLTAIVTGMFHFIFFPDTALMGGSGIVFAFILLASITGNSAGDVPITFILVALLFIGDQIITGVSVKDNISQITHIIGGAVGAATGFAVRRK